MNRFLKLMEESIKDIKELMPWDLEERLAENPGLVIVDVLHVEGAVCGIQQSNTRQIAKRTDQAHDQVA